MTRFLADFYIALAVIMIVTAIIGFGPRTPPPLNLSTHPHFSQQSDDRS